MLSTTVTSALAVETLLLASVTVKFTGSVAGALLVMVALKLILPRSVPEQFAIANTISLLPTTNKLDAVTLFTTSKL